MASVRLDNVSKDYGEVRAVSNLTLSCRDGEMLALLGPSGCGKTSTLKMIAGIEEVTQGQIFFDERPVTQLAPGERNIAMVFEDYALYPHMTVFENVAFPLKIRRQPRAEIEHRVSAILELLHLGEYRNEIPKNMSGGVQQRISIGRALVREPELLLFDEPLSHLDGDQKVQLRSEIKRLQNTAGLTAILVTHDQTEAVAMADLVAVMSEGVLQQLAKPEELYAQPANLFVASFIGEPPMNLLPATCVQSAGNLKLSGRGWQFELGSDMAARIQRVAHTGEIIVGVRPEHIDLRPADGDHCADGSILATVTMKELRGDSEVLEFAMSERKDRSGPRVSDENRILVEVESPSRVAEGNLIALRFKEVHLKIFDSHTGRNLLGRQ